MPLVVVALPMPRFVDVIPLRTEDSDAFKTVVLVVDSDEMPKLVVPVTAVADSFP